MQRIVEGPFAFLFPSKLQPAEVARKLERALEDNSLLQSEGRHLAPDVYDIYLSFKDHQQMTPIESTLKNDWREHLVQFARKNHYTLRTDPLIRLHAKRDLRPGTLKIEAQLRERGVEGGEGGAMATQAISAEQLEALRKQLPGGNQQQGSPAPQGSIPTQYAQRPPQAQVAPAPQAPAMPQAWLTIRSPQTPQKVFRMEKQIVNIGRQLSNDIIVEDKRVSRYHAQIKFQPDGQFAIFDLGSTNGITVNGVPHLRQHLLRNGDRFTIGSYDFYYERR